MGQRIATESLDGFENLLFSIDNQQSLHQQSVESNRNILS